ncbi:TetR/AcrR family transcriptional regulator [Desulfocurvus sp. DL9XJH121]
MIWRNGVYEPRQKRGDEKQRRLLLAARELFSEQGFHKTTAKDIASRAGAATGSFYRYFRDKKAAFMAVCLHMEEEMMAAIFGLGEDMRREGLPARQMLESMVAFAVRAHQGQRRFHREVLAMQLTDPDVAEVGRRREEKVTARLREFLAPVSSEFRVRDFDAAVALIHMVIEEVAHLAVVHEHPLGEERLTAACTDMLGTYLLGPAD